MDYFLKISSVLLMLVWVVGGYYSWRGDRGTRGSWILGSLGLIATAIWAIVTKG